MTTLSKFSLNLSLILRSILVIIDLSSFIAVEISFSCAVINSYLLLTDLYSSIEDIFTSPSSAIRSLISLASLLPAVIPKSSSLISCASANETSNSSHSLSFCVSSRVSLLALLTSSLYLASCSSFSSCASFF